MEATSFDNKTVERFIKVRAMATNEGATDAERLAFQKKLEKMEAQTPGITAHVDAETESPIVLRVDDMAEGIRRRHFDDLPGEA